MQAQRGLQNRWAWFSNNKTKSIKGTLSAQSQETRGLATVQQKMELHEAAINALALEAGVWGRVHIRGRASSRDLLHYSVLCQGFTLSRTLSCVYILLSPLPLPVLCISPLFLLTTPSLWRTDPIKSRLFNSARIKTLRLIFKAVPYKICNMFYKMTRGTSIF